MSKLSNKFDNSGTFAWRMNAGGKISQDLEGTDRPESVQKIYDAAYQWLKNDELRTTYGNQNSVAGTVIIVDYDKAIKVFISKKNRIKVMNKKI